MDWKRIVYRTVRRRGFNIVRYGRVRFMESCGIAYVLDVGANTGQYALGLRDLGYAGRIWSFEPMSNEFRLLSRAAERDPDWEVSNTAVGSKEGTAVVHVSANSYSSSLMDILPRHQAADPRSAVVGTEEVSVRRLDDVTDGKLPSEGGILLKVDTQGFEMEVLLGAKEVLHRVDLVQLEMSLVPLYDGSPVFDELYSYMRNHGFELKAVDSGFTDSATGAMLQVDGLFQRVPAVDGTGDGT